MGFLPSFPFSPEDGSRMRLPKRRNFIILSEDGKIEKKMLHIITPHCQKLSNFDKLIYIYFANLIECLMCALKSRSLCEHIYAHFKHLAPTRGGKLKPLDPTNCIHRLCEIWMLIRPAYQVTCIIFISVQFENYLIHPLRPSGNYKNHLL
jgi:hypothetical protein